MVPRLFVVLGLLCVLALGLVALTPPESEAGPVWRWATRGVHARREHRRARRAEYSGSVSVSVGRLDSRASARYSDCGRSEAVQYSDCGRSDSQLPSSPGVGDRSAPAAPPFQGASSDNFASKITCECGPGCNCGPTCQCAVSTKLASAR